MMPKPNEYVLTVKGLLVARNADLDEVAKGVDEYINLIPELAEGLISSLFDHEISRFLHDMEILISLLEAVHARWLTTSAETLFKTAKRGDLDWCRTQIGPLITELYSLSIEMQMAQLREENALANTQSMLERYTDLVNNLSAVEHLIENGEGQKARDMLLDMADIRHERSLTMLLSALMTGDNKKAAGLTAALKKQYVQKIADHNGSVPDSRATILAVDDSPIILTVLIQALRKQYRVLTASSGKAALNLLSSEHPDLFLLDIEMPKMNGYQLANKIRTLEGHREKSIVFLTGNATRECILQALKAGASDYVVKPVNTSILLSKINKFLL